jgi:hypothetical protein
MRNGNLATIGKSGFLRRPRLPFDDGNIMSGLMQKPGRSGANNARAQYDDFHDFPRYSNKINDSRCDS